MTRTSAKQTELATLTVRRIADGPVPEGGGHNWEDVTSEVELTVDWHALFEVVGKRALRSNSGRSVFIFGAVKAKVVNGRGKP